MSAPGRAGDGGGSLGGDGTADPRPDENVRDGHVDVPVPRWVRVGLVVLLAAPQLIVGVWAVVAPRSWFDSFPGVGPALVAGDPPFNQHLASDVGAAFVATGAALLLAAYWGTRRPVQLALATFAVFTIPHVTFHTLNPAPGLSATADVANAALLASGLGWAALLWWGATRDSIDPDVPVAT